MAATGGAHGSESGERNDELGERVAEVTCERYQSM